MAEIVARGRGDEDKALDESRGGNAALFAAETIRPKTLLAEDRPAKPAAEGGLSTFWRVFGGTILSIAVLIILTICNQFSAALNDLRRDVNAQVELRTDFVRKADLDRSVTSLWTGLKESRISSNALDSLGEKSRSLEQQLDRLGKAGADDRKELLGRIEENRKSGLDESRDAAKKLEQLRKTLDDERKDFQRKLDEQRKAGEDERKELIRKFEEKQRWFEDQNKELSSKLQALAERLAAVESLQNLKKSAPAPAVEPATKSNANLEPGLWWE